MKIQYVAVIFVIIILPIALVLSEYVNYNVDMIELRNTYNTKLLDATYDCLKSYQLSTISNSISDISASKIEELEAAVKSFYNSLTTNFNFVGYQSTVMEEYVPAIVFTMYDGYYIYSPYQNVLTDVEVEVDEEYNENTLLHGIKPYIYYSCRYTGTLNGNNIDIIITYTLDNYITVQGTIGDEYVNKYGYLLEGVIQEGESYKYSGVSYTKDTTETLSENVADDNKTYKYVKLNGTKYYLDESKDEVFFFNSNGERYVQASKETNEQSYNSYRNMINKNNSAYRYYKEAFEFTQWVRNNLSGLSTNMAKDIAGNSITNFGNMPIFNFNNGNTLIEDSDSNFNAHRSQVIRYTIETNLATSIKNYNIYYNPDVEYIMPNISETDWETLENNICVATFLQGFKTGSKDYNEYCVVANNLTKEYVDENDIYLVTTSGSNNYYSYGNDYTINIDDKSTYYRANDTTLNNANYAGIWKLNFELKKSYKTEEEGADIYYCPMGDAQGSYTSIISGTNVDSQYQDMYKFMRSLTNKENIKKAYYTALGRERWGAYHVNNDLQLLENSSPEQTTTESEDEQEANESGNETGEESTGGSEEGNENNNGENTEQGDTGGTEGSSETQDPTQAAGEIIDEINEGGSIAIMVDCSGSMSPSLMDVVFQLRNLMNQIKNEEAYIVLMQKEIKIMKFSSSGNDPISQISIDDPYGYDYFVEAWNRLRNGYDVEKIIILSDLAFNATYPNNEPLIGNNLQKVIIYEFLNSANGQYFIKNVSELKDVYTSSANYEDGLYTIWNWTNDKVKWSLNFVQ